MTGTTGEDYLVDLLQLVYTVDPDRLATTPDEVFNLLRNEHRRHLILYLIEQETASPLSRVAMELTSQIHEQPVTEVTPTEQKQMRLELEHKHLPHLADSGILSWSHGEDTIEPIPSLDSVDWHER